MEGTDNNILKYTGLCEIEDGCLIYYRCNNIMYCNDETQEKYEQSLLTFAAAYSRGITLTHYESY